MSETLADEIVRRSSVSVEMPAGTGKTWTLAACAQIIAANGERTLILTHTNAGVYAIRAKLAATKTPHDQVHVSTITSFAFELVRSYSTLAGVIVPETPDWDDSIKYLEGACRVLENRHIQHVIAASFTHLLVDEYQDCTHLHHRLILSIKSVIPKTAVFGDRLQGIFGFKEPLVDWATDVTANFSTLKAEIQPHRWRSHNQELGAWILDCRKLLVPGNQLDLSKDLPDGASFVTGGPDGQALRWVAGKSRAKGETTVVITASANPDGARSVASKLRGYVVMEDIGGSFMSKQLQTLATLSASQYAAWLATFLKKCFVGYSGLDKPLIDKLRNGTSVVKLKRDKITATVTALDSVRESPSLISLGRAMRTIQRSKEARLYAEEAWQDTLAAIERCALDPSRTLVAELARVRDRLRYSGRTERYQIVSRTLLIKGLEYDHVIIADLRTITDACHLYVALSRARKTLTIVGASPQIVVTG